MSYEIKQSHIVMEMLDYNPRGNVIPHEWYLHLRTEAKNSKPYDIAINLLADICYWYRPSIEKDEVSGEITYRKKFKGDLLQRSYGQFKTQFGYSKDQIKRAVDYLADRGLIYKEFRNLVINGQNINNVLYIGIFPEPIKEISYTLPRNFRPGGRKNPGTNTEITQGEEPKPKKRGNYLVQLRNHFSDETGIDLPNWNDLDEKEKKSFGSSWNRPLKMMHTMAGKDMELTKRIISACVDYSTISNRTIETPRSIKNQFPARLADSKKVTHESSENF